jgi:hypothetical protein
MKNRRIVSHSQWLEARGGETMPMIAHVAPPGDRQRNDRRGGWTAAPENLARHVEGARI